MQEDRIRPRLDPFHMVIMFQMWNTSTSWSKDWSYLSLNDLAERCVMSRRKVMTTLNGLVELGLLTKRRTPDKTGYMINYRRPLTSIWRDDAEGRAGDRA